MTPPHTSIEDVLCSKTKQQKQEELGDKDLRKKLYRIMYKVEGRGMKFFLLSPLGFFPLLTFVFSLLLPLKTSFNSHIWLMEDSSRRIL
jgi:hypothetical protein